MSSATILAVGASGGLWLHTGLRALWRWHTRRVPKVAFIDSRRSRAT